MGFSIGQLFSQAAGGSQSTLNLSTKIALGFAAVGLFVTIQLVSTVNTGQSLVNGVEKIVNDSSPIIHHASKIQSEVREIIPLTNDVLRAATTADLDIARRNIDDANQRYAEVLQTTDHDHNEGLSIFEELEATETQLESLSEVAVNKTSELVQEQQQKIDTFQIINKKVSEVNTSVKDIHLLIEDTMLFIDNEIVVSMVHEFTSSLNYGLWILEKIKNARTLEAMEDTREEFNSWISAHSNLLPSLIYVQTDDEEFQAFVQELGNITNLIFNQVQGEQGLYALLELTKQLENHQQQLIMEIASQVNQSRALSDELLKKAFTFNSGVATALNDNTEKHLMTSLIMGVLCIAMIVLISLGLSKFIKRSMGDFLGKLSRLSEGEVFHIDAKNSQDEFSQLNNALA